MRRTYVLCVPCAIFVFTGWLDFIAAHTHSCKYISARRLCIINRLKILHVACARRDAGGERCFTRHPGRNCSLPASSSPLSSGQHHTQREEGGGQLLTNIQFKLRFHFDSNVLMMRLRSKGGGGGGGEGTTSTAVNMAAPSTFDLVSETSHCYSASFQLPPNITAGDFTL